MRSSRTPAFGVETNRVTIISRDGSEEEIPLMLKREIADIILDRVLDRVRSSALR